MDENGEHGQEPTERERSAAEMEALHQAMMEELGIGRRDALPLEDRAANVSVVPLALTSKRVRPENPASMWHNFHPDDVEPGLEDLDDIAGGQLYRLRRGGTGLSSGGRGGHLAGRGRGGGSNRGGHASVGGRGNFAGRGRDADHSRSGYFFPPNVTFSISCRFKTNKLPVKLITMMLDVVANLMLQLMLALLVYNVRPILAE
ncbi:hypothetical protein OCU04_011467 [Sclerotinia nivalis]|uniref:Uncharacterized protein n=1 Tax=Sclerotinia nivalis TaxID=352851 RepID=A0A9X0DFJ5_9HELO|nr:hypothetical protein OCU04_011467 [Sclerotinia nivalis]